MPALSRTTGRVPCRSSETAARRAELHDVAGLEFVGDVGAGDAVGFALDAEAIGRRVGMAR